MAGGRLEPWEQRDGESAPAYEAFITYRDMGLDRSTAKVAHRLGKTKTLMDRWSSRWSWVARVRAWDRDEDRRHQVAMRARRRTAEERNLRVVDDVMRKVVEGLMLLQVADLKPIELARLIEVAAKLEAMTLGMATDRVAVTGAEGGPVQVDVSALTDEERHERLTALLRQGAERERLWRDDAEAAEAAS